MIKMMKTVEKITLHDGRELECFLKEQTEERMSDPLKLDTTGVYLQIGSRKSVSPQPNTQTTSMETRQRLFISNLHMLLAHSERILSDSRMFFTPIIMHCGLAYTGGSGFGGLRLGIIIEWLLNCPTALQLDKDGKLWIVCSIAGSPLSGSNSCRQVDADGNTRSKSVSNFISLWSTLMNINGDYAEVKGRYQSYTIEEVLDIFQQEGLTSYSEKDLRIIALSSEIRGLQTQLQKSYEYNSQLKSLYHEALMASHTDALRTFVQQLDEYDLVQAGINRRRISRAELRQLLRAEKISNKDYERQILRNRKAENAYESDRSTFVYNTQQALSDSALISETEIRQYLSKTCE